jgi:hypothetical protein
VHAGSAGAHRERVLRTNVLTELLFEALGLGPVDEPVGPQRVNDLGDIGIAEVGFGYREEMF